ncbi:unnamed protein product [Urochloa decumbens]|uniref:Myb-like domain-containing protein n=1 Tax=Urochloa decumbens TaxID=240449 RepID=A0ABC9ECV7_9POAL
MKLRCMKMSQKFGTPKQAGIDCFDEDCVETLFVEDDNDSDDDYIAGAKWKQKVSKKSSVEEPPQQKVKKDKSQVPTTNCKRTLKDALVAEPEKKLTNRIRQKRMKEVKTLLEAPCEEIDPMKLSFAHLRLLQEAKERVHAKEIPSGPSSITRSFQLEAIDDLDYRDEEARNFDNDITENHVQSATKLNYHSYMNKQTRAKWSKSDTDMFYKGLRQFGSDFAIIQQLIPCKTRHQVRAKFKTEEKKNPLQVHDAIAHRSVDNLYFKKVIKQLNIENVVTKINDAHKQGASNEGDTGNEDALDGFINEEDDGSHWLDEKYGLQMSDAQEEHVSGNEDDLGDVFDWY